MSSKVRRLFILSLLLVVVIDIFPQEQDSVVVLPYKIASKVLADLEIKDNLELKLNIKDSTIIVLQEKINAQDSLLSLFKLNEKDYKKVIRLNKNQIENLNKEVELTVKKEEYYKKKVKRLRFKNTVLSIVSIGFGILLI